MNLQQLNDSGQHLWVFLTTAISSMVLTGTVWLIIVQVNSAKEWIRTCEMEQVNYDLYDPSPPDYSIGARLLMLCLLCYRGHTAWLVGSNAYLRILTNSPAEPSVQRSADVRDHPAGHHVSRYIRLIEGRKFRQSGSLDGGCMESPMW